MNKAKDSVLDLTSISSNFALGVEDPKFKFQVGYTNITPFNDSAPPPEDYAVGFSNIRLVGTEDGCFSELLLHSANLSQTTHSYVSLNSIQPDYTSNGAEFSLKISDSAGSMNEVIHIDESGRIAINNAGTTHPQYTLHVAGNINAESININGIALSPSGDTYWVGTTGTFTDGDVNATADTITSTGHGLSGNDPIKFATTGTLPDDGSGGLTANETYYVLYVDADTFSLTTTPSGTTLNLTADGTGTHTWTLLTSNIYYQGKTGIGADPGSYQFAIAPNTGATKDMCVINQTGSGDAAIELIAGGVTWKIANDNSVSENLTFSNGTNDRVFFATSGNVGIGTSKSNPQFALDVAATINCDEIIADVISGSIASTGGEADSGFIEYVGLQASPPTAGKFYSPSSGDPAPTGSTKLAYNGEFWATKVWNSVWNDIAEYMPSDGSLKPGDLAQIDLSVEKFRLTKFKNNLNAYIGIISENPGMIVGHNPEYENPVFMTLKGMVWVNCIGHSFKKGQRLYVSNEGLHNIKTANSKEAGVVLETKNNSVRVFV